MVGGRGLWIGHDKRCAMLTDRELKEPVQEDAGESCWSRGEPRVGRRASGRSDEGKARASVCKAVTDDRCGVLATFKGGLE